MKNTKATLSADGETVHLNDGSWSEAFPVKLLAGRIAFYERLRDHKPGKDLHGRMYDWPGIYGPTVAVLKRVQKLAQIMKGAA